MTLDEHHTSQDPAQEQRALVWTWVRFVAMCLTFWFIGYLLRIGAGLSGGHDGRPLYVVGAIVSTGALVLRATFSKRPPLRITAGVLAGLTAAFWLLGLHGFLASPGLQW